jgi:fermentation-respiration switch protein FrsA (DUF1100 family)
VGLYDARKISAARGAGERLGKGVEEGDVALFKVWRQTSGRAARRIEKKCPSATTPELWIDVGAGRHVLFFLFFLYSNSSRTTATLYLKDAPIFFQTLPI